MAPLGARTPRRRSKALAIHEVLLSIGAGMALVLGPVVFLVDVPIGLVDLGLLPALFVNILGGSLLLLSIGVFRRTALSGFLLAFSVSLVLLGLGGLAGGLGGIFGLVGSLYGLLVSSPGRFRIRLAPSRGFLRRRRRRRPPA